MTQVTIELTERHEAAIKYLAILEDTTPDKVAMKILGEILDNHIRDGDVTGLVWKGDRS